MMKQSDIEKLEQRAHAALVGMATVCEYAGVHRQSWYRARKRGSMGYELYRKLLAGLARAESEQ